jgi:hypothetical protein
MHVLLILLALLFPVALRGLLGAVGFVLLGAVAWYAGGGFGLTLIAVAALLIAGRRPRPLPEARVARVVVEHRHRIEPQLPPAPPEIALVWDATRASTTAVPRRRGSRMGAGGVTRQPPDERREHKEAIAALFEKLSNQWREEQNRCLREIERLQADDRSYMGEGVQLLELAQNAQRLFEKQVPRAKRRLLNFLLSNCTWEDGEVVATRRQPFDLLAETTTTAARLDAGSAASSTKTEIWLGD